jgi:hypothetical protein
MTSPAFVTFTDPSGETCRVSTQGPIFSLSVIPVSTTPGGVVCTRVRSAQGFQDVQGTVAATATALGIVAPTGPGVLTNTPQGTVALASYGTDAVSAIDTYYWSSGFNPTDMLVTNIACLNGTTAVGTDLVIYAIWDSSGAVLGWTALAGTLAATADVFQSIALVTPITITPGRYFVGFVVNGTTTPHQTIAASTYPNYTGTTAGTFGAAVPAISPSITTTAGVGPFWRLT